MKIRIKSLDDAISEQAGVLSGISSWLDKALNFAKQIEQASVSEQNEYNVNLSDESPYKELEKDDLLSASKVKAIHDKIVTYMYLPEELAQFAKEYTEILAKQKLFKERKIQRLQKLLQIIRLMPPEEKDQKNKEEKQKEITNARRSAPFAEVKYVNLEKIKTLKELVVQQVTKAFTKLDDPTNIKENVAKEFEAYTTLDELAAGIESIIQKIQ